MPRPKSDTPTERELDILNILWESGPSTARDVHTQLSSRQKVAYNSVLTILSIMLDKGYVRRDESRKSHVYEAVFARAEVQDNMLTGFMDRVFGGSALNLVNRALEVKGASQEDKDKIAALLKAMEDDAAS